MCKKAQITSHLGIMQHFRDRDFFFFFKEMVPKRNRHRGSRDWMCQGCARLGLRVIGVLKARLCKSTDWVLYALE